MELNDFDPKCQPKHRAGIFGTSRRIALLAVLICFSSSLFAQKDSIPFFTTLRMEVRAELNYQHQMSSYSNGDVAHWNDTYGFTGKYFNIHVGGNLGKHFSYYFRQRIVANPGSVTFFDNTDFLYLDYHINDQWSLRVGKEALAVGGYEYDAAPIDVLFNSYYWDQFYCFQLAFGATYKSKDGKNTLRLQVANSPYLHYGSPFGQSSLLSYNFLWNGDFNHFHTLYSISMFQRDKVGHFMNYIALGNKLSYDKWCLYLDLMHHANSVRQLMKDFGVVCRADYFVNDQFSLFAKGAYEQNKDAEEWNHYLQTGDLWDWLATPGQQYFYGGIGFELRPKKCPDVRIHGYLADFCTENDWQDQTAKSKNTGITSISHNLMVNAGISWNINFLKYLRNK
ncbi:MAG: OprO/OprP family phosphate-selective porin [Bacteroidales bacterium]|nr:OprO/OprP family phosphate-selective porin [Bacteroidales bacterium]